MHNSIAIDDFTNTNLLDLEFDETSREKDEILLEGQTHKKIIVENADKETQMMTIRKLFSKTNGSPITDMADLSPYVRIQFMSFINRVKERFPEATTIEIFDQLLQNFKNEKDWGLDLQRIIAARFLVIKVVNIALDNVEAVKEYARKLSGDNEELYKENVAKIQEALRPFTMGKYLDRIEGDEIFEVFRKSIPLKLPGLDRSSMFLNK